MVILRVDLVPGTGINEAAEQMISLAKKLSVMVTASFNGFHMIAHPNTDAGQIVHQYDAWRSEESKRYKARAAEIEGLNQ